MNVVQTKHEVNACVKCDNSRADELHTAVVLSFERDYNQSQRFSLEPPNSGDGLTYAGNPCLVALDCVRIN